MKKTRKEIYDFLRDLGEKGISKFKKADLIIKAEELILSLTELFEEGELKYQYQEFALYEKGMPKLSFMLEIPEFQINSVELTREFGENIIEELKSKGIFKDNQIFIEDIWEDNCIIFETSYNGKTDLIRFALYKDGSFGLYDLLFDWPIEFREDEDIYKRGNWRNNLAETKYESFFDFVRELNKRFRYFIDNFSKWDSDKDQDISEVTSND